MSSSEYTSPDFERMRNELKVDDKKISETWNQLNEKLETELQLIRQQGTQVIPEISYDSIVTNNDRIPNEILESVYKRGVLIIRGTIATDEIAKMKESLFEYMKENNLDIEDSNKTFIDIYWSKSQMAARQHPNMFRVQKALLALWKNIDKNVEINLEDPKMYIDRMRIRQPGTHFDLKPHVDGGGVDMWCDPSCRKKYEDLFDNWENFDPYLADQRADVDLEKLKIPNGCTFFRGFQGWLSLSNSDTGSGTLRVLPLLKEATAYWFLRPFLPDVPKDLLPGCSSTKTFYVHPKWHQKLYENIISLPKIEPGDTVWWHPDIIHSVESEHQGSEANIVFYIPAGPDTPHNRRYLAKMRSAFEAGRSPPDFEPVDLETNFQNRAAKEDVDQIGNSLMGWN